MEETDQAVPEQTPLPATPDETRTETDQNNAEEEPTPVDEAPAAALDAATDEADEPAADDEEEEEAPVVPVGQLQVASEPSGASVWIGGQVRGVTPLSLSEVEAGPQQVTLRLDGYEDFTTTVEIVAQQQHTVNGQLEQSVGTLKILVRPWGAIYIDGELRKEESSIWYVTELPAGLHRVRVVHPSLGKWEQVVEVPARDEHALTIDFNKGDSDSQ